MGRSGLYSALAEFDGRGTEAFGINDLGQIVGDFADSLRQNHGFLESNGVYTRLEEGAFEVYDINNNNITGAAALGTVGLSYQVAGFGNFNGPDMMTRNSSTSAFELYDIANNSITGASQIGQVGLEWKVAGFGRLRWRRHDRHGVAQQRYRPDAGLTAKKCDLTFAGLGPSQRVDICCNSHELCQLRRLPATNRISIACCPVTL